MRSHHALSGDRVKVRQGHIGGPLPGGLGRRDQLPGPNKIIVFDGTCQERSVIIIVLCASRFPEPWIDGCLRSNAVPDRHGQPRSGLQPIHIPIGIHVAICLSEEQQGRAIRLRAPGHRSSSAGKYEIGLDNPLGSLLLGIPCEDRSDLACRQAIEPVGFQHNAHPVALSGSNGSRACRFRECIG